MTLLVVGSIGIDTVTTPFGKRPNILGGAASYFSVGASLFTPVRLAGVNFCSVLFPALNIA